MKLTTEDKSRIEESIRGKYAQVASSPSGLFKYPTGRKGLELLGYDQELVQALPEKAVLSFCGVGNPFSLGPIHEGEVVLDIGCGTGLDSLVAAMMVGPEGRVVGIDMVPEMLERANQNLKETNLKNVFFRLSSAENLPFPDSSYDVIISNGVFNLIPDKIKAVSEIFRVLKPEGRLMMADQVLTGKLPEDPEERIKSWFR
jgi:SAM-dependent methyltransferase